MESTTAPVVHSPTAEPYVSTVTGPSTVDYAPEPANVDPKALLAQGQAALKASNERIALAGAELAEAKTSRDAALKLIRAFSPRKARQSTKKAAPAK